MCYRVKFDDQPHPMQLKRTGSRALPNFGFSELFLHWRQFLNIFLQDKGFPIVFSVMNSLSATDFVGHRDKVLSFYHATLCVSAVFAVARCLFVRLCLSCSCIVSRRLKISLNFFLGPVVPYAASVERAFNNGGYLLGHTDA